MNPTFERVLRYALAGAIAGLIIFLVLNPSMVRSEADRRQVTDPFDQFADVFISAMILGTVVALVIGCCLVLAEELGGLNFIRLKRYLPIALGVGVVGGAVCGFVAQVAFSIFMILGVVIARTIGWCLMGAGAGMCLGAAYWDTKKSTHGAIGGAIGGGVGGILFDALAAGSATGSVSRAVGFVAMGVAIGAAVALVEEMAKEHWITILTGSREGRAYILSKPETTIGRDELADIPLFGDPSIQKIHAKLVKVNGLPNLIAQGGQSVTVNSAPAASAWLSDGDIIGIGSHKLRFNAKAQGHAPVMQPVPAYAPAGQLPNIPVQVTPPPSVLAVVGGPHQGETFGLTVGPVVIGRDHGCGIPLPQDGMVSRNHAKVTWDGRSLRIQDLGSTNGIYVNGQKTLEATLSIGDVVSMGQTAFSVG